MLEILGITGPIYLTILIGAAAVHFGLFQKADMQPLGKFVLYLALPCLIFNALSQRDFQQILNLTYLASYATGTLVVIGLGLLWTRRVTGLSAIASIYATMGMSCPNSGFVGFPVLLLTLPMIAPTAFALNLLAENLLVIPMLLLMAETAAHAGAERRHIFGQLLRRLIFNPLILAIIAGGIAAWCQWRPPEPIGRTIALFAQASIALSLLVIGGTLVGLPLKGMQRQVIPIVLGKLIVHPLAVFVALWLFSALGIGHLSTELRQAVVLLAAMPTTSIYPILAQRHGLDGISAAALLATTLGSFFTLNILIWLIHIGWI